MQEPLFFLYKVKFSDIPPIHLLNFWEYPKMYQRDFNIITSACVYFVYKSTHCYLNKKIRILCYQMYVTYE